VALAFSRLGVNTIFIIVSGTQTRRVQAGKVAGSPSFAFAFARLEIGAKMENEGDVRWSNAELINIA
jgi:hypothetical protein